MNITTEDRMDSIEQQLKELRKEMEESIARYNAYGKSYPFTHGDVSKFHSGQIGSTEQGISFMPVTSQQQRDYINEAWEYFKLQVKE